jgi:hypothetical protein
VLGPCVTLGALAAWIASLGLERIWLTGTGQPPAPIAALAVAAALHAAWAIPAASRNHPLLVSLAWTVSVWTCRGGLIASGFSEGLLPAAALETIALALALSAAEAAPWADRLARWRRARQRITTEVRMSEGLAPWLRASVAQLLTGRPERPAAAAFDRMVAELADANERMQRRITALALPDAVRQSMLTAAQAITTRAETAAAEMSIRIERQALDEAAACRDAIAHLPEPAAERERLAREREALMLDLAHGLGPPRLALPWRAPSSPERSLS